MKDNIFDLAKAIANSEPGKLQTAIRNAGFGSIPQARAIRDLSEALVAVWDGKASTLDQATAWRQVWAYCASCGLVRGSMNSHADGVLDAIEALRVKASPQPEMPTAAATAYAGITLEQALHIATIILRAREDNGKVYQALKAKGYNESGRDVMAAMCHYLLEGTDPTAQKQLAIWTEVRDYLYSSGITEMVYSDAGAQAKYIKDALGALNRSAHRGIRLQLPTILR